MTERRRPLQALLVRSLLALALALVLVPPPAAGGIPPSTCTLTTHYDSGISPQECFFQCSAGDVILIEIHGQNPSSAIGGSAYCGTEYTSCSVPTGSCMATTQKTMTYSGQAECYNYGQRGYYAETIQTCTSKPAVVTNSCVLTAHYGGRQSCSVACGVGDFLSLKVTGQNADSAIGGTFRCGGSQTTCSVATGRCDIAVGPTSLAGSGECTNEGALGLYAETITSCVSVHFVV